MRRYFITGGTGFIGRGIVRALLKRKDTDLIMLLTRNPQLRYEMLSWSKRIKLYEGDVLTDPFPHDMKFTDLIHGANEANDLRQPDLPKYYYTIVEGTNRVLDWAKHQSTIERRLILSSGAAARDTVYGRAKRMSEWLVDRYVMFANIARLYNVIGEEMPLLGQYASGVFVGQAICDRKIRYYGGLSQRNYLDINDCAEWLLTILEKGTPLLPYDVAGEESITIAELAQKTGRAFGVPVEQMHQDVVRDPDAYIPDLRRAKKLGLRQTISLDQSLERIHAYFRDPNAQSPAHN